jgi:hypothetical protein
VHGWHYVGPQAVGAKVFHPGLGKGTVTGHDGKTVKVRFTAGGERSFGAKPGKGPGKLEKHAAPKVTGSKAAGAKVKSTSPKPATAKAAPKTVTGPGGTSPKAAKTADGYLRMTNAQAEKWGNDNWPPPPPLPADQHKALAGYSTASYMAINKYLRDGIWANKQNITQGQLDKYVGLLDKALKDHPTPSKALVVHRGVGLDALGTKDPSKLIGKTVQEKGFLSTSVGAGLAETFEEDDAHLEVRVPAGTPAFYMDKLSTHQGERELLLGRNMKYKIISAQKNSKGQWQIQAEIVHGGANLANRRYRTVDLSGSTKTRRQNVAVKTPAPQRAAGRRKLAKAGQALDDGSFPIPSVPYLKKAIRSAGRAPASKRPGLKALIRKRARELKATNAAGVKGTWAFQGASDQEAVELATITRKMPIVRGPADVQMARTAPGMITVRHKSSGMKIGTMAPSGKGYMATHADGTDCPPSGSQQGALAALIGHHNKAARKMVPANQMGSATYTAGEQETLDFAGALPRSTPAVTSGDGPRVTMMGGVKTAPAAGGMAAEVAKVYKKLLGKGMSPKQAMALAKRAAAMHAKAAAKAA